MRRIVELDGLRGLACLVVLFAHYFGEVPHGSRFLALGWSGVDLFFVLSGFLIGNILLMARGRERFFSTFYIRRGFRIFPTYYAVIIIVFVFQNWSASALPAFSYFTYLQNILMVLKGQTGAEWLSPTWTLCVEEQFYLLLPLIIYITPEKYIRGSIISFIVSGVVFRIFVTLMITDKASSDLAIHILLPARWDLLFWGVLAAHSARCPGLWQALVCRNFRTLKLTVFASFGLLPVLALIDRITGATSFDLFGCSALGAGFAAFILLIVGGAREAARFRSPLLRLVGQISYCLYLIHQPVAALMHAQILGGRPDVGNVAEAAVTLASMVVSLAIAFASWQYFERPLIEFGHRWATRDRSLLKPELAL